MKPFDLEAAKRGEPIVCRDGTPAKFIAHVPEGCWSSQLVVMRRGVIYAYDAKGVFSGESPNPLDLFMAPKKRTVWVNLYARAYASWFKSKEAADESAAQERIGGKAYPVEIEE